MMDPAAPDSSAFTVAVARFGAAVEAVTAYAQALANLTPHQRAVAQQLMERCGLSLDGATWTMEQIRAPESLAAHVQAAAHYRAAGLPLPSRQFHVDAPLAIHPRTLAASRRRPPRWKRTTRRQRRRG